MNKNIAWALVLMVAFALSRWPGLMPQNFSATYAIVFCAGLYFPPKMAWSVPLITLLLSDLLLSLFHYGDSSSFSCKEFIIAMLPNYLAYFGLVGLGRAFGPKRSLLSLLGGGILGALLFYIVTNTASWLNLPYPKTLLGWIQALTVGLPGYPPTWEFFRNTLLSGGLFSGLFVAAMKLLEPAEAPQEEEEPAPEAEPEPEEA